MSEEKSSVNAAGRVFDIASFGEAMALFLANDGALASTATQFTRAVGGAEVNVMVQCARLGLQARYGGLLGDDANGKFILRQLLAEKIDCAGLHFTAQSFTGILVRDYDGVRPIDVAYARQNSAASKLDVAHLSDDWLRNAYWLHATGITPALSAGAAAATARVLAQAKKLGLKRSFDINLRRKLWSAEQARAVIEPLLSELDVVFGGADEITLMTGTSSVEEAAKILLARGNRLIVVSNGAKDVRVFSPDDALVFVPHKIPVVDVVGAGDAFVGGILSGLIAGLSIAQSIEQGMRCGALVVSSKLDYAGQGFGVGGELQTHIHGEVLR